MSVPGRMSTKPGMTGPGEPVESSATFDSSDQLPALSAAFKARKYVVPLASPDTVKPSGEPEESGVGALPAAVATAKFASVIWVVEYRTSYRWAVPTVPLSPGADQVSVIEVAVTDRAARSRTADGADLSLGEVGPDPHRPSES